jgi:rubrerythrin
MAKTHFFDVSLAVKYGPIESIILTNLCWWIEKNRENRKHYFNGRYWVYNSITAFEKLFPYLSGEQIRRILNKLREDKVLIVGKYNKTGYDRTLWYTVNEEVLDLYRDKNEKNVYLYQKNTSGNGRAGADFPDLPNGKYHLADSTNGNDQTVNSICRIRQMDLVDSTDRFGESTGPIPYININKAVAAALPEEKTETPEKEAAAKSFFQKITKETVREALRRLNGELVFDSVFYKKAEEYLNSENLDTGYLAWIYRECLVRKPASLRGMYYTLTFKQDLTEIYKALKKEQQKSLIVCPVCGREHSKNDITCPECHIPQEYLGDGDKINFEKRFYQLDEDSRERFVMDLADIYKNYRGPECEEQAKGVRKKYHLIE